MYKQKVWCLVPAAGLGSRLDTGTPKQYIDLLGKALIRHTLDALGVCKHISGIVVGLAAGDEQWRHVVTGEDKILGTYLGGASRAETVLKGLYFLEPNVSDGDWVLIHDAARPCVRVSDIERLISSRGSGSSGAILAVKAVDTLKEGNRHQDSIKTLPRDYLWHAQTPQIFPYKVLRDALEACDLACLSDDSSAMEIAGHSPKLIVGSVENLKVTTQDDLELATIILQARYGILHK